MRTEQPLASSSIDKIGGSGVCPNPDLIVSLNSEEIAMPVVKGVRTASKAVGVISSPENSSTELITWTADAR